MSALSASTSSLANSSAYSKASPSGLDWGTCGCSFDTSIWLGHQSWIVSGAFSFGSGEGITGLSLSLLLWDVSDDTAFLSGVGESGCKHGCDQEPAVEQSGQR